MDTELDPIIRKVLQLADVAAVARELMIDVAEVEAAIRAELAEGGDAEPTT